jgi:hypothetical protein
MTPNEIEELFLALLSYPVGVMRSTEVEVLRRAVIPGQQPAR